MAKKRPKKQFTHQSHWRMQRVGGTLQKSVVKDDLYVHDTSKAWCTQTWAFWLFQCFLEFIKWHPNSLVKKQNPSKSYLPTTKSWWLRWVSPEASPLHGRSCLGNSWATHKQKYPRFALHTNTGESISLGVLWRFVAWIPESQMWNWYPSNHQLTSLLPVSCMWYHWIIVLHFYREATTHFELPHLFVISLQPCYAGLKNIHRPMVKHLPTNHVS